MQDIISVIINSEKNDRFLERCLFALLRQTYSKIDVIVLADEADYKLVSDSIIENLNITYETSTDINAILASIKGQYTLFIDSLDIPSKNLIYNMHKTISKTNGCVVSKCYVINNDNSMDCVTNRFSLSGKMFETEGLKKVAIQMQDSTMFSDFYMKCSEVFDFSIIGDDCYYYKSVRPSVFKFDRNYSDDEYKRLILRMHESKTYIGDVISVIQKWIKKASYQGMTSSEKVLFISSVFADNSEMQLYLFEYFIQKINASSVIKRDYQRLSIVKSFMEINIKHGNTPEIKSFIDIIGVDKKTLLYLLNSKYDKYILMYNQLHFAKENNDATSIGMPREGYELSRYIIDQYKTGGLGLKTIIESFGAYAKSKFKF